MDVTLRQGHAEDAGECGRIAYAAFKSIAEAHNFPPDLATPEVAGGLAEMLFKIPGIHSVIAERDGRVIGSNFLWEQDAISGVGPITVDPGVQNASVGRRLMEAILERSRERRAVGVRLVQSAYHNRSLSLYAKLGFHVREPLVCLQGEPLGLEIEGYAVRPAIAADREACNRLCFEVHGHHRGNELSAAIQAGTALAVEHAGRITGYATGIGFFGHAVGESNEEIKALIGAARSFDGPGFLLPTRNAPLFRWVLERRLRVVQVMTLMSVGLYNEPQGAFLPSILY